jgi:hypothetical protein
MDGPAAAIVNAITAAAGIALSEIPATPERIAVAMTAARIGVTRTETAQITASAVPAVAAGGDAVAVETAEPSAPRAEPKASE